MGCAFFATGQFGFDRHLEAGEMVAQVAYANAYLRRFPIDGSSPRSTSSLARSTVAGAPVKSKSRRMRPG
mgnify:CR=1 FL=1